MTPRGEIDKILNEFRAVTIGASKVVSDAAESLITALMKISADNSDYNREQLSVAVMGLNQIAKPGVQLSPADLTALKKLEPVLQEASKGLDKNNTATYDVNDKLIKRAELVIREKLGQSPEVKPTEGVPTKGMRK